MTDLRIPPGRTGRTWLTGRLRTARRAAGLLDRKLRILRGEQERLALIAARTATAWAHAQREADQWLACAAALGGQREIRFATPAEPAAVRIDWDTVMGVRYPREATYEPRADAGDGPRPGTSAIIEATNAHQRALQAAVAHAAAAAAGRILDAEVAETRRRTRAINDRWIPRLELALRTLTERLDEAERAEAVQLRWASGHAGPDRSPR